MSEILTDSTEVVSQEVQETEPVAVDVESQTDYWSEDVDMHGDVNESKEEVQETEPVENIKPEYITNGLGNLDKPLVVKVKGKTYDLQDLDQIRNLVEKGFVATQKMQEVADMRRELLKEQNPDITPEELDVVDTGNEVERVAQNIMNSSYADDFQGVVGNLPESVTEQLRGDPKMLQGLSVDVESGLAQKIMPQVDRLMTVDGLSFREAYMRAGKSVMDKQETRTDRLDKLVSQPTTQNNVVADKPKDIWDMSSEQYNALINTERR